MKYLKDLLTNKAYILIAIFTLIAIFLHMRSIEWPSFNSDEASFAYNAYSILQTGRDEYGHLLPTRFLAFGENKLPVTIYTILPFIGMFGLNETAARLPFILIGVFSPLMFFLLSRKLTGNQTIGIVAAFLAGISPWIQIMSRHIHEDLIMLVIVLGVLWYLIDLQKKVRVKTLVILAVLVGVALFTYHMGKVLAVFVLFWTAYYVIIQKESRDMMRKAILLFAVPLLIFGITELMNPSTRISNLLFTNTDGFTSKIEELRREHPTRLLHNKVTASLNILSNQYLSYFSPEFLVRFGDNNARFGFEGISPISAVEFGLLGIGLFYAFQRKDQYRFLLLSLLLITPMSAAISWQESSLTRSFIMIIPILFFVSYGMYHLAQELKHTKLSLAVMGLLLLSISYFTVSSWDYYFHHYPKQPEVIAAWQSGYHEMGTYLKENYDDFDRFYVTNKLGQPYIFALFYTAFPPEEYQKQAQLSALDEYGFGQVSGFGKFIFEYRHPDPKESAVVIGYPGEFSEDIDMSRIKKITVEGQDVFWIYEGQRNK